MDSYIKEYIKTHRAFFDLYKRFMESEQYVSFWSWSNFVDSSDIGLRVVAPNWSHLEVSDEKKWFINKIKYGF